MPFLTSYRRVLAQPGTAAFSASGFLARLQISMITLGIVLLVAAQTGSYSLAGTTSAANVIAYSMAAIGQGRLIDRFGQARVLLPAALLTAASLAALVWSVDAGQRSPLPQVFAAAAGASSPAIGAAVRARWTHALAGTDLLQTAFALEAVVDECVYFIGPPLATLLSTGVDPAAGLVAAIITGLVGTAIFTALRRSEPPVLARHDDAGVRVAMPWLGLVPMVLVSLSLGGVFGSTEVTTVGFAQELGHKPLAGVLLACWSLGSLLAGLVSGSITWRALPAVRMRWGILALTALMAPTPFVHNLAVMGGLLFLAGFAISPTLIATVSYIEQTVPAARLTEGITVLSTALGAGLAPGAAIAGVTIDHAGASHAYYVTIGFGLIGVAAAFLTRTRRSVVSPHEQVDELVGPGDGPPDA
jgi:predicted MFS family arabinose efflux permease